MSSIDSWRGRFLDVELRWSRLPDEIATSDLETLSPDEQARAAAFRSEKRRLEYVSSRAYLRRALGDLLGISASSVSIHTDDSGKPQHAGGVHFNLSHSAHAVLIGWGSRPMGVDLEAARRRTQHIQRLSIVAQIREAASVDLITAYTLAEAATKAHGQGLAILKNLRLHGVDAAGEISFSSPPVEWIRALAVPVPGGYVGAVAVVDSPSI